MGWVRGAGGGRRGARREVLVSRDRWLPWESDMSMDGFWGASGVGWWGVGWWGGGVFGVFLDFFGMGSRGLDSGWGGLGVGIGDSVRGGSLFSKCLTFSFSVVSGSSGILGKSFWTLTGEASLGCGSFLFARFLAFFDCFVEKILPVELTSTLV